MAERKKKMPEEKKMPEHVKHVRCKSKTDCGCGGALYFLGFIGALVYYLSTAPTFWIGLYGVLKALLWPAFLIFELLKYLGM